MADETGENHLMWWFELLMAFGMTPGEWGELRRDRRVFLEWQYLQYRNEHGAAVQQHV